MQINNEGAYAPAFEQSRKRLRQLSPEQITKSSLTKFRIKDSCFYLESFGHEFSLSYPEGEVFFRGSTLQPAIDWRLVLLNYFSSSKEFPLTDIWVSYRDLPQGNVFFPAIKNYILAELASFYSTCDRVQLFDRLKEIGFSKDKSKADLTAKAFFAPRVPILIQFWEGDEEITSSCQILFDSSITYQLHIEDIAALCSVLKSLIVKSRP